MATPVLGLDLPFCLFHSASRVQPFLALVDTFVSVIELLCFLPTRPRSATGVMVMSQEESTGRGSRTRAITTLMDLTGRLDTKEYEGILRNTEEY